ncbi:MAG: hypothetical protein KJ630_04435 [Proteobacteria bacterium]|nr:hypothetical protein [Pseudomonadota bacterium]
MAPRFRLSDLFVSRYMHSNPEYRKEGAELLKDVTILEQMVKIDVDQGVREAAAKRLAELNAVKSDAELENMKGVPGR